MTLEELKAEIEKLKESTKWNTMQIGILDAIASKIQQQPEQPKLERWKPEGKGKYYWLIDSAGEAVEMTYISAAIDDKKRFDLFNCFPTKEEAEKEALRTRARRKLEWLARELNAKAALTPDGFIIYLCKGKAVISGCTLSAVQLGAVFFYNKADAEYALSQMTAEELEALQ